ncbi:MAG: putative DNA binding domain-containing protein [Thermoflexales bacterium]|nr:putative DNA binding domain-containing protein [Thermoflexales bacterium]MDW8350602.1 putative DNA binding domain-containing protein [Anaerolineae bacterium]
MAKKKKETATVASDESQLGKTTEAQAESGTLKSKPARNSSSRRSSPTNKANKTTAAEAKPPTPPPSDYLWKRVDLHIHTPASHDYEEPNCSYLDILKQAERRGLSIIAFTDHNTVNGYRNMMNEIEHLEYLEKLDRIRPEELARLNEYRRLLKKILVLPGFEFTATFGFHILGIFSPDKPLRDIEHILIDLRVPSQALDKGLTEAGATSDVLQAYEAIDEAGGIAIAAHANSSNGVAMRGRDFGGQTRIAFTQDPHLHAIEFTDLDRGRYSSAHLFTGIKSEYPRRMFAIQGSDAHRLIGSKENAKRLGVGERATEIQLDEVSFEALRNVFLSQDFSRVRPVFDVLDLPEDELVKARERGPSASVAFHPSLPKRGDRFAVVLRDICAMANGEGGSIFIGCDAKSSKKASGVSNAQDVVQKLSLEIEKRIAPRLLPPLHIRNVDGADVLQIQVPRGEDAPYVLDGDRFFVRADAESRLATRDEIVAIARRGYEKARPQEPHPPASSQQPARRPQHPQQQQPPERRPQEQRKPQQQAPQQAPQRPQPAQQKQRPTQPSQPPAKPQPQQPPAQHERQEKPKAAEPEVVATAAHPPTTENGSVLPPGTPKTGVQVLSMEERNGVVYFTVRDLRNNSIIRNVTMKSARDLWHYAITQFADHPSGPEDIEWQGDRAVLAREMRAGKMRSDLAMRDANGKVVVFYGVTDDGLDERWRELIAAFGARNGMAAQSPAPPADGAPPASPEQTEAQASQATEEMAA